MTDSDASESFVVDNDRSLRKLSRAITQSQGNFALILVRCNYQALTDQIIQQLQDICPIPIRQLNLRHLSRSVKTLYTTIHTELGTETPQALIVLGLDSVDEITTLLTSTNQVREEFRKQFHFPFVLWVNDEILQKLNQFAPDFKSWAAISIKFEMATDELNARVQQTIASTLTALLEAGAGRFLSDRSIVLPNDSLSLRELDTAVQDLQQRQDAIAPAVEADLQFLIGREADLQGNRSVARQHYERSLAIWQRLRQTQDAIAPDASLHSACLLYHLGLWWRLEATLHRMEYRSACEKARDYFQACLDQFRQSDRPDLEGKFISALGEVLVRLEQWDDLKQLAERAIALHQAQSDTMRLAYGYGLRAEVALYNQQWTEAKAAAELALQTNENTQPSTVDRDEDQKHYRNYYRLLLAQAQQQLNQIPAAIALLESAQQESLIEYDPLLYIRILENLRSLQFAQGRYLEAFQTKQECQSIEQQYGLRAFVGAGRLQARKQVTNRAIATVDQELGVNQEIAASGRLHDIHRLMERIERADHKLTIIYGQSGVGKSSLVQAGLLPALKQMAVEARDVLPVLLQVYSDWAKNLGVSYAQSYEEIRGLSLPVLLDSMTTFLEELRKCCDRNLFTVLIFDQFEEFFFAYKDSTQRKPFFEFLRNCFNIPYVKIILSLREDYLHYLLEFSRLVNLDAIDNNILDKKILYYLGNFSPEDAKSVIDTLTRTSQVYLQPALVDALVEDLAGSIGEVRPIELQVVGAQLQSEDITTLVKYQERGPKEALVGRFLEEVVTDCGVANENVAKIILYLLTDDNNTRPLKTRAELATDLAIASDRLDLILKILVKSGLVFQIPGFPTERYQLVHDYLVPFIRQQQSATLVAELEKEREQRKLTEAKLNQALKRQLKTARRATFTLASLVIAVGGIAIAAIVAGINLYAYSLLSSPANSAIDRSLSVLRTGKLLKQFPVAIPGLRLMTTVGLNGAIANNVEINRLEDTAAITKVIFSPDGQRLASINTDNTVIVWNLAGKKLATLKQQTQILAIVFSPDGQQIALSGEDQTIKISTVEGKLVNNIPISGKATSLGFSPDGKLIAASIDHQVIVWQTANGQRFRAFPERQSLITSLSFSPDGSQIAIADQNDSVQLQRLDGQIQKRFENYGTVGMKFSPDGKLLILNNRDSSIKYYDLDGTLVKNVESQSGGDRVLVAATSPNGKLLALVSQYDAATVGLGNLAFTDGSYIPPLSGHSDRINDLAFSPDGQLLASASQDKTIRLWNIAAIVDSSVNLSTWSSRIRTIQFNKDSSHLAVARYSGEVQLLDKQGRGLRTIVGDGSILKFSPDGQALITRSAEARVTLDRLGKQPISLGSSTTGVEAVVISPDGNQIVAAEQDGKLKFWRSDGQLLQAQTSELSRNIQFSPDGLSRNIQFSPDGQRVALISPQNRIYLWTGNGQLIHSLSGHTSSVSNVYFSPNSQRIVTIGDDNLIHLYDKDGQLVAILKGHLNQVSEVSFSPDSAIIASSSSDTSGRSVIKLWSQNGTLLTELNGRGVGKSRFSSDKKAIQFSPDNKTIAILNADRTVQLWTIEGQAIATLPHNGDVTDLDFSSDGRLLATASADTTIRLWDVNHLLSKSDQRPQIVRGHLDQVKQVLFNPNGQTFVSVSRDGMIQLWRRNGARLKTLQPASSPEKQRTWVNSIQFSQDGKVIVAQVRESDRLRLKLWNDQGKELEVDQRTDDLDNLVEASFSPTTKNLVLVKQNPVLKLWGLDGSLLATFQGHRDIVNSVSFSPDGQLLASASDDKTVKLWNRQGQLQKTLFHTRKVNSVSFSPDGQLLASASDDKTVKLWNRQGQLQKTLKHKDKVNSVSFSPDGQLFASASDDKTVKLWNRNGQPERTFDVSKAVKTVDFSPNSQIVTATLQESGIKLWQTHNTQELKPTFLEGSDQSTDFDFSPDSSILLTTDSRYGQPPLQFSILNKVWIPGTSFSTIATINSFRYAPDGKTAAIGGNDVTLLEFDLDRLLSKECALMRDYLANAQTISASDRHLCDGIPPLRESSQDSDLGNK
jgi:WD40 repeat protein/tetratricopeptide (TPR) repeat protein